MRFEMSSACEYSISWRRENIAAKMRDHFGNARGLTRQSIPLHLCTL